MLISLKRSSRKTTTEDKFRIIQAFFYIKDANAKKVSKKLGIGIWSTNRVISEYFKNGSLIINSKMNGK